MSETSALADHLIVLGNGKLLADSSMEEFIDARSTPRALLGTSDPGRLRAALALDGFELVAADDGRWTVAGIRAEQLGGLAAREGVPLLELSDGRASLEQAYLDLTADHAQFSAAH